MLRCLFGKCSRETYIVNPSVTKANGVSPSPPSLTKPLGDEIVGTITQPVPETPHLVDKNGEDNNLTSTQILSDKLSSHENTGKDEVPKQVLPEKENSDQKGNNISAAPKPRPQAPQPPGAKETVNSDINISIPEPKEQHTPKLNAVEQNNNYNSEISTPVNVTSVDSVSVVGSKVMKDVSSPPVISSRQEENDKIEKIVTVPVVNSDQDESDKIETVVIAPAIKTEQEENNIEKVVTVPVVNSDQDESDKIETVVIAPAIKTEQEENNIEKVVTVPVVNSDQDESDKIETVVIAPAIKTEQEENNIEKVVTVPVVNSDQDESDKIETVVIAPVINPEKNEGKKEVRITLPDQIVETETPVDDNEQEEITDAGPELIPRRSGIVPMPINYDESKDNVLPHNPKDPDDEALIKSAIENNDFLNKIMSGKMLNDVIHAMYNKEIVSKETIIKQGEKGSHMYISAKGKYQVVVKGKVVSEFDDVRVFGELAILYNAKRLATIKALTPGRVWVLDRNTFQQIMIQYNYKEQDEIMRFLMKNKTLNVVGKDVLQEVANLLKPEFFSPGTQIVRQGDKGHKFYIISAGTVTITKDREGVKGVFEKGDCFGELALLKEDSRQATVTANPPGVECLTLTRKQFIDYFGEVDDITKIQPRPQNSIKDAVVEHGDVDLADLQIIKTLGVGGFGRVELVQHTKRKELVFALKYLKKIDIVLQHQQDHVYNEKVIQMTSKSPFIIRLYRTYKDTQYIYFLMESCLGGDLFSLLQKQKTRRFDEKEARFIAACVLEAFDYLHSRGIVYRDLKPENLLIAANGYIKLTDFGFAKKISSRGRTYTFAGTPEYVAPEIVLNKGHDRAVDYWAFGAFIFELLTGRTPFRTDDSTHMKTYNKILNGIDNIQFPSYVNLKARHIIEKLCRPIAAERLGMQRGGIKDIKAHKWFLGWDWQKFAKCEMTSPFKPKLKGLTDTQYFDKFKKDTDNPPEELSGWDENF